MAHPVTKNVKSPSLDPRSLPRDPERPFASYCVCPLVLVLVLAPHLLKGATGEGMLARHHFVEDHAQRPDIVGSLGRAAGEHLGREVGQCAAHILKPDPPDCDEKQPSDQYSDGGCGVVSADDPGVEVGGVIEH